MPLFQHILIVEAGAPLQTGLCRQFARWGFVHVTAVATGADALQQAAARPPDLVLLSASVTDGPQGPDLVQRLQAHHGPVPVLVLVPETWQLRPLPATWPGVVPSWCLPKPPTPEQLQQQVEASLGLTLAGRA